MIEKIKYTISENKGKLILVFILWVILSIVIVGPLTVSIDAHNHGFNFIKAFIENIQNPFTAFVASLSDIGLFLKTLFEFTIAYIILIIVGIKRALPKSEYENIEYGSSAWCTGGEQYRVLSPKSGILLAEKNYLPLDKLGNTNVLVIRRFWCG